MKNHNFILAAMSLAIFLSACSTNASFVRSTLLNQNVYKTKDTLELKKVYNYEEGLPAYDSKIYKILPKPKSFIRYSIQKQNPKPFIYILPHIKYQDSVDKSKTVFLKYSDKRVDDADAYYYQFTKKSDEVLPARHYLATEHITALPITIPIKFRFNVPTSESAFSLNAAVSYAFGYKFRLNNDPYADNFFRWLPLAVGFSTATYLPKDSVNVKGYKGPASVALNLATGFTFEFSDRFNVGAFVGVDRMFYSQRDWVYQNKAWIGFGFGYKFSGGSGDKKEEKDE